MCWPRQLLQVGRHRHVRLIAALLALAPDALVLADARPPALLASAPAALVLADARPPALLACAPDALVLADARPPALLACVPLALVRAEARPPALLASAPLTVMRAFRSRLRRPGPLLPPLRLRLLPSPPLPACRFPLAPALSALAPLLAMPTRALSPASAPTTAPSFTER